MLGACPRSSSRCRDSGIGKAAAALLAERGCDVGVSWQSDRDGAEDTARQVRAAGRRAAVCQLDLQQLPCAGDVIDDLAAELGELDGFVNNAGGGETSPFLDLDYETWPNVLRLNLDGAFVCAQPAAHGGAASRWPHRQYHLGAEHVPLSRAGHPHEGGPARRAR